MLSALPPHTLARFGGYFAGRGKHNREKGGVERTGREEEKKGNKRGGSGKGKENALP